MTRFIRKTHKSAGAAPGTLTDAPDAAKSRIHVMRFREDALDETEARDIDQALALANGKDTVWVHVMGVQDTAVLHQTGRGADIHVLTLEDIANPGHRPKFEEFDDHFFVVIKHLAHDPETRMLTANQISIIAKANLIISFQENEDPCLEPVRQRIRSGRGRIRTSGAGYLTYAIVDAVVDHYFKILENIGDEIESLETEMLDNIESWQLEEIHRLKREMIFFHKQVWPLREVLSRFIKSESPLIPGIVDRFMGDVNDHMILIMDTIDSFRELTDSMLDFYMSSMENRMNQVMRTLTIIATIFIPLTFLAGIYGMNFRHMPELDWKWGYFGLLGLMFAMGTGMLIYFKRKKWF